MKEGVGGAGPVLDHDPAGLVLLRLVRKLVAERHAQPVALARDTLQAPVEPGLDADLVGAAPPDDLLCVGHLHREMPVEAEERHLPARLPDRLRRRERRVAAGPVVDDRVLARAHRAREHVPDAGAVRGALDPVEVGDSAGRDDDDIGLLSANRVGLNARIKADLHPEPLQLTGTPLDDARELAPPACLRGHEHLPAEPFRRFAEPHVVAPLGAHPRGLQPGRAAACDQHPAPLAGALDRMRQRGLVAGGRIVNAGRAQRAHAMGRPHAGAHALFLPTRELGHQLGVRDVRAGHRHHVEQALADRVPRRLQRRDPRRMKDGQPHRLLEGPGAGQERRLG